MVRNQEKSENSPSFFLQDDFFIFYFNYRNVVKRVQKSYKITYQNLSKDLIK